MNYSTFFIDADDTLFDFQKSSQVAFEKSLLELKIELPWLEVFGTFKKISSQLWLDFELGKVDRMTLRYERFTQTFKHYKILADSKIASAVYLENLCSNVFFMDGAVDLLRAIKDKGYPVIILTNGISYVQKRRLENSEINELIDYMVVSEDCAAPKPHTSMFEQAHRFSNSIDKKNVLMFGDSLTSDIQGALNFGIDSCWFNPAKATPSSISPTYQVHQLSEFVKLFLA